MNAEYQEWLRNREANRKKLEAKRLRVAKQSRRLNQNALNQACAAHLKKVGWNPEPNRLHCIALALWGVTEVPELEAAFGDLAGSLASHHRL